MKAHEILTEAAKILEERGKLRDTEQGERSMARAVSAFNALVPEKALTEGDGWLMLCCLKMARATAGKPHLDDAADLAGYAALLGEWVAKQSQPAAKAEDDGWIPWAGGECPVDENVLVYIRCRDGHISRKAESAVYWTWHHKNKDYDIIAYKVVD